MNNFFAILTTSSILLSTTMLCAQGTYIPPDHKGEPASSAISFFRNDGQVVDSDGNLRPDIHAESWQSKLKLFLKNNQTLSYILPEPAIDSLDLDSVTRIDMFHVGELVNVNIEPEYFEPTNTLHHYVLGHCPQGVYNVPSYKRVVYREIYPGIDFQVYSNPWGYKYYYVVHPGADPSLIQIQFAGHDSLRVDVLNDIKIYFKQKFIKIPEAIAYQDINGQTFSVSWGLNYVELNGVDQIGFNIGSYNNTYPLIVDISKSVAAPPPPPTLPEWGTYYGDGLADKWDQVNDMVTGPNNTLYTCGFAGSIGFPTTPGLSIWNGGNSDGFISSFDSDYNNTETIFYGGNAYDSFESIALGAVGLDERLYVFGETESDIGSLPTQSFGANSFMDNSPDDGNCVIAMFDPNNFAFGPLWSTRFAYNVRPGPIGVVDGKLFISGEAKMYFNQYNTTNTNQGTINSFPVWQTDPLAYYQDIHMGQDIFPQGGTDGFIAKFNEDLELEWSTLFGGNGREMINGLAFTDKDVVIGGYTTARREPAQALCQPPDPWLRGFPLCDNGTGYYQENIAGNNMVQPEADGFLAVFNSTSGKLEHSTYFGGITIDNINTVVYNKVNKQIYVGGISSLSNIASNNNCGVPSNTGFPICNTPPQFSVPLTGNDDGFVASFLFDYDFPTQLGELTWSSYVLEGYIEDLAVDKFGNVFATGSSFAGCNSVTFSALQHPNYHYQPVNADASIGDCEHDGFIMGFDENDVQILGTFYGGVGFDQLNSIEASVGSQGRIYVGGETMATSLYPYNCPVPGTSYCYNGLSLDINGNPTGDAHYGQLTYDITTSVEENTEMTYERLGVFPNPADNSVSLVLPSSWTGVRNFEIRVFDLSGRLVNDMTSYATSPMLRLDIQALAKGLYFIEAKESTNNKIARASFVKQ